MKKVFILSILSFVIAGCLSCVYSYANDTSLINEMDEDNLYTKGKIDNVKEVQYVGNGYLVTCQDQNGVDQTLFTYDFSDFRSVNIYNDSDGFDPFSRMGSMDEIIWADGKYIARSDVYDNIGKSGRVLEDYSYLYILDDQFNLTDKIKFDHYIREISYIDGCCYVCVNNESYLQSNKWGYKSGDIVNKVLMSDDLINWEMCDDLENVPINNGKNSIVLNDDKIFMFKDRKQAEQILYEEVAISHSNNPYSDTSAQRILNKAGEYFYIVDNNGEGIWMSCDGIYFTKCFLNSDSWKNGCGVIYSSDNRFYVEKEDLNSYMTEETVYVNFNGCFLGFSTPPVIENGRTLVPMRFLFEQMGADVEWEPETSTASARIGDTEIKFSIDSADVTVNGEPVKVDVPARLIDGKTMVPLRFLSEELGYTVTWDEKTRTAVVEQRNFNEY